jgi:hypothetical protein
VEFLLSKNCIEKKRFFSNMVVFLPFTKVNGIKKLLFSDGFLEELATGLDLLAISVD